MLQKIKKITVLLLLSTLIFSISYADDTQDQLDVKTDVNNMRNSVQQPGILGNIFTKIFDVDGKIKEMYLSIVTTFTQGFIPVWNDAGKLIDGPIFSTGGNVGIGTTNPLVKLEVNGDTIIGNVNGSTKLSIIADIDNSNELDNPELFFSQDGGGISAFIGIEGNSDIKSVGTLGNNFILGSERNIGTQFITNDIVRVTIGSNGNVGIGLITPSEKLEVDGNIIASEPILSTHLTTKNYVDNNDVKVINDLSDAKTDSTSVFVGSGAGLNDDGTLNNNTAIGESSMYSNTTGANNTAIGINSMYNNTSGNYNTANGSFSLNKNTTGISNTANGYGSLYSNTSGNYNTADGYNSLNTNTEGDLNTANGYKSLFSNTTGNFNTANGGNSLYSNTTGSYNVANGRNSLFYNTTGNYNTANGYGSLYTNTGGLFNTANGYLSLYNNTTGNYNIANGASSLRYNTTGNGNVAIGTNSLYNNTIGGNNVSVGIGSLYSNTTGANNTSNGAYSLKNNVTGSWNIANGYSSMYSNISGANNTANGYFSLYSNIGGTNNTSIGRQTLYNNTEGSWNTSQGVYSLYNNTTGEYNTGLGINAGYLNSTGSLNVFLGNNAGYNETGSNTLYIDNSFTTAPLIKGDFATNKLTINGSLQVTEATDTTCDAANEGTIRFDSATKNFFGCDGTIWKQLDN